MKNCYKCGPAPQPPENFYNDRSNTTGKDHLCKHHRRAMQAAWRETHREQEKLRTRDWRARRGRTPLPHVPLVPHAVITWQGARYRIQRLDETRALLSSGQWVPQAQIAP